MVGIVASTGKDDAWRIVGEEYAAGVDQRWLWEGLRPMAVAFCSGSVANEPFSKAIGAV